ncbi:MAG: ABC transporter permease [Methylobacteriaceae bacterium]|nr:ABC transporter permease [Methylobacteriaceae bacterium]
MLGALDLVVSIALTHVRARLRQTLVGVLGVATGVGFSVMMAALMQGSQDDFVAKLVDALPHISVTDERRAPALQPAERDYAAAEIRGQSTPALRPGVKNPYALMASLEAWLPGAVAPSAQARAVVRYAGRDSAATIIGVDPKREPRVSKIVDNIREGTLESLQRVSNGVILGDGLAKKIGARVGNAVTLATGGGRTMTARVVALYRSGNRLADESQAYTLLKTAQILAGQTGLVNEIRIRLVDVMAARDVAAQVEAQSGYKSVSWQEQNQDLLSAFAIRNLIMYTVVGAILLVASFGTFNIVSTITHEKTRDIAIMKSLGLREALVRRIFVLEALIIGLGGLVIGWALGYVMSVGLGAIEINLPFGDRNHLPIAYDPAHYAIAGAVALASSVFAGWFPARKAASLHPVEIIRGAS